MRREGRIQKLQDMFIFSCDKKIVSTATVSDFETIKKNSALGESRPVKYSAQPGLVLEKYVAVKRLCFTQNACHIYSFMILRPLWVQGITDLAQVPLLFLTRIQR